LETGNCQKVMIVPGDGIGREVTAQAVRVLEWFGNKRGLDCNIHHDACFGAEYCIKAANSRAQA